jgi:uncharacterized protein (UPF0261 family)
MGQKSTVLLVATMDTKADEAFYIESVLNKEGVSVFIMDPGIRGNPPYKVSISRDEVARAAGVSLEDVRSIGHEGKALSLMTIGAVKCAQDLYDRGNIGGIIGLGGTMGTTVGTAVMRSFEIGIPKVMISTMASSNTRNFVGTKDILMLHSVCDISGVNRITKRVLHNGALALAGMVKGVTIEENLEKPVVALTSLGTTDACAGAVRKALEEEGYEVLTFHTNGTGGKAMEETITRMDVSALVDISLHEISAHMFGSDFDAGPDRGKAALKKGVPTVIAPGNIEFLVVGPVHEAERRFPGKKLHSHNEAITAVRVDREQLVAIARTLSEIWNEAKGPISIFVPMKGFSSHDSKEGHLHDPEAPPYFANALKDSLKKDIPLHLLPYHINDIEFAQAMVKGLKAIVGKSAN